ncbi:MAG: triose-phosphate isomerase family protein [Minisyncoccota bacterium]
MRSFYVIGNLKMNLVSREEAEQYLAVLSREMDGKRYSAVKGVICPPFVYLSLFDRLPSTLAKGAQDVFPEKSGAYTGEVSPTMLKNEKVEYVIIGHSERRKYANETDAIIKEKVLATLKSYLIPVVCIGETQAEKTAELTDQVLSTQVRSIFSNLSKLQAEKIILAYEPRWAIGTDIIPTTDEIAHVRMLLQRLCIELFDKQTADRMVVIYGGSVKSAFLGAVSWKAHMNGVLVGRESLFPYELVKMMGLFEAEAVREDAEK